jgi:hypothetical protein
LNFFSITDDCWNDIAEFLTPKALKEEASSSNQSLNAVSYQSLENVSMEIPDVSWDALAEEMLNYSYCKLSYKILL